MQEWQPISTAPRDGSDILVCNATLAGGYPNVVAWDETLNEVAAESGHCWWTQEANGNHLGHHTMSWTHWMPLPAFPDS